MSRPGNKAKALEMLAKVPGAPRGAFLLLTVARDEQEIHESVESAITAKPETHGVRALVLAHDLFHALVKGKGGTPDMAAVKRVMMRVMVCAVLAREDQDAEAESALRGLLRDTASGSSPNPN